MKSAEFWPFTDVASAKGHGTVAANAKWKIGSSTKKYAVFSGNADSVTHYLVFSHTTVYFRNFGLTKNCFQNMVNYGLGVPVKVLHEAEGHIVTVEASTGETYRGILIEAEDNMNLQVTPDYPV